MTKFYEFDQNNSGGSFVVNDKVCRRVIIDKAETLGVYFDGWGDRSCCGNRWHSASDWSLFDQKYVEQGFYLTYEGVTAKSKEETLTQIKENDKYDSYDFEVSAEKRLSLKIIIE
jgi:hypothetical protein